MGDALLPDAWLSGVLGRVCFTATPVLDDAADVMAEVVRAAAGGPAFVTAKRPAAAVAVGARIARSGFALVDVALTFERPVGILGSAVAPDVMEATAADADELGDLAATAFTTSRFHLDPLFTRAEADTVKREWAMNACRGNHGTGVLVVRRGGMIEGFLATNSTKDGGSVIDLIAVAAESRGSGVGARLVAALDERSFGRFKRLRVGTQVANIAAIRFYESRGFRLVDATSVFHAHVRGGRIAL